MNIVCTNKQRTTENNPTPPAARQKNDVASRANCGERMAPSTGMFATGPIDDFSSLFVLVVYFFI